MAISNEPLAGVAADNKGHSFKHWVLFLVLLLAVAGVIVRFVWMPRRAEDREIVLAAKQQGQAKPVVEVLKLVAAPSARDLSVPGTALAYVEASIYARSSGYVKQRLVDIGDHVRKGQLLALIDAPDLDQQVAQARSVLAQSEAALVQMEAQEHLAQLQWDRYKVLVAKGVFSKQDGDNQEAALQVAQANSNAARSTVEANRDNLQREVVMQQYERVTAPFTGVVTARNVDVGTLISAQGGAGSALSSSAGGGSNNSGMSGAMQSSAAPATGGSQGGAMFTVAAIEPLRILVSVPEPYAPFIHLKQKVGLTFEQFPGRTFEGVVTRTSGSIDPNTRTLLVEVQTGNPDGRLMPGNYVVATFNAVQAGGGGGVFIPGETIVIRNGKTMVATVVNNRVQFKPIQIGRDYGDQTEVLGGLKPEDIIVRTVTDSVRENVEIEPRYRNEKADSPKRP
jgi:multidrug efflux pump subunit AcrA (membrane-fusion protein)